MSFYDWMARRRLLPPATRLERFPPFRRMGIEVLDLAGDWRSARIRLPLIGRNTNPGGSMFGGCMASLADPIAALACARLFPDYSVWTRTLHLDFVREGRTDLELRFEFHPGTEERIRLELSQLGRSTPEFEFAYYLTDGGLCARIRSRVAIRVSGYVASSGGALKKIKN